MNKTKFKLILSTMISTIVLLVGALSATLTWFAKMSAVNLDISGSVLSQYFDSGDGTQEDPFIITRPKHWENLVWLHNNISTFYQAIADNNEEAATSDKGYYFQVGRKNTNNPGDDTLYVYDYKDDGLLNSENKELTSRVLNLNGLNGLIPIGSSNKPFIGELKSDGITIKGFDILGFEDKDSDFIQDAEETGFNDVGIFGYIGKNSYVGGLYFDDFRIHLSNTYAERSNGTAEGHNTTIHDSDKNGTLDLIYAGYIAGHIHGTSNVSKVYINNCKFLGGNATYSGFGYFGVAEDDEGNPKPNPLDEIKITKQAGEEGGFGGSIDMKGVYQRLSDIFNNAPAASQSKYVSDEVIIKNNLTDTTTTYDQSFSTVSAFYNSIGYKYYSSDEGGSFALPSDNDTYSTSGTSNIYQCLFGTSTHYTKTVTTYTFTEDQYDAFYIQNGSNYLNHHYQTSVQNVTNQTDAASWRFDGSNHLYTKVFDETYYLNSVNNVLTLQTSGTTVWTQEGDELYTVINGYNYYLDFDSTWCVTPFKDRYLISDGSTNYLNATTTSITNSNNSETCTKWILTNPSGNTQIAFFNRSNSTMYYLGNVNATLGVSTSPTTWNKDGDNYYVTLQGIKHFLVYDNGTWGIKPENGIIIGDGNNNYLSLNGTNIANSTNQNDTVIWHLSSTTGDTQIFCIVNGVKYYLNYNNGLVINTTAATWHRNGSSLYITVGDTDYYLTNDGGWKVVSLTYYTIHDSSNTNYLVANGTSFTNTTNPDAATHFYFSDESGANPTGNINYVYGGNTYFLNVNKNTETNGVLEGTTSSSNATSWSNDGNSIYLPNGNFTYYLEYNNSWQIRTFVDGRYITDGTNYMTFNGTTIGNTTNKNEATIFIFSDGSNNSGTIKAVGTSYYLRANNANLQASTTSTSWSNNGNNLYYNTYYLVYRNGWILTTAVSASGYYISYNNRYMNLNGTTIVTSDTPSTLWDGIPLSNPNQSGGGDIYAVGTNYHLYIQNNTNLTVNTSTRNWFNANGKLYYRQWTFPSTYSYYVYVSNNNFTANRTSNNPPNDSEATKLTITNASYDLTGTSKVVSTENSVTRTLVSSNENPAPSVTFYDYSAPLNTVRVTGPSTKDYSLNFNDTKTQECVKNVENNVKSGNSTYFPLRVDKDESGNYPANYAASPKNTGYVISGANLEDSSSYNDNQKAFGDIRFAGWPVSKISGSYSNNSFSTIYTVDGENTIRELNDTERTDAVYQNALQEYGDALNGTSRVFGLHFMDATISMDHTIRAKQATILGKTYYNYELPEDAIDFNVYERGKISFFAGEYFTNNSAFFSLHRIFRDSKNDISDIKEILEIYQHNEKPGKVNYIYKFSDGTYTNKDGSYTGATSLNAEYKTTPVFKTSWITSPSGLSTSSNRIFFFSIPCNSGEYALGSVGGKAGAYLNYLDIAANGGDNMLEIMKTTDTATTFDVDFRSASDTTTHSILQIGVDMPSTTTAENLEIRVTFDNSEATCEGTTYTNGLYTIYVTNKTGVSIDLAVLLIDDDDDLYNDFNYAYKIVYTNENNTGQILQCPSIAGSGEAVSSDYWQRMAIVVIPSNGTGAESDYQD